MAQSSWIEGKRFIKAIIDREPGRDLNIEILTLECGHRFASIKDAATHVRCRFCIRAEMTGYNPEHDQSIPRIPVTLQ